MAMKGSRLCFYLKLYFIFITTASVFSFQVHVSGFIQFSIFQGLDLVVYLSGFRYSFFYPSGFISSFISIRVQTQFSILQGLDLVFYPSGFISSFLSFRVQMQFSIFQGLDLVFYTFRVQIQFSIPSGFRSRFHIYYHCFSFQFSGPCFRVQIQFSIFQGLDLAFYPSRF